MQGTSWGGISVLKRKAKSVLYKYVSLWGNGRGKMKWRMFVQSGEHTASKFFDTEIEAAKAVDLYLIRLGRNPVNGLFSKKLPC